MCFQSQNCVPPTIRWGFQIRTMHFYHICTVHNKLNHAINTHNLYWLVARSTCHDTNNNDWGLLTVLLSSSQHRPRQYLTSDDDHILRVFVIHYSCTQSFNNICYQTALFKSQTTGILKFQFTKLITITNLTTHMALLNKLKRTLAWNFNFQFQYVSKVS